MGEIEEYEASVHALLEKESSLRSWFESMRGFAKNGDGRTVILGLSPDETIEFLNLHGPVQADWNNHASDREELRERYIVLHEKHVAARQRDVAENLAYWTDKPLRQ